MSSNPENSSPDITILQDILNGHGSGDDFSNLYNQDCLADLESLRSLINHDGSSQFGAKPDPSPYDHPIPGPSHRNDYLFGQGRVSTNDYDKEKNPVNFSALDHGGLTQFGMKPWPTAKVQPVPLPPGPSVSYASVHGPGGIFANSCAQNESTDRVDTSLPNQPFPAQSNHPVDPFAREFGAPYFTDDYPSTTKSVQPSTVQDKSSGHGSHVTVPHNSSSTIIRISSAYRPPVTVSARPSHRNDYQPAQGFVDIPSVRSRTYPPALDPPFYLPPGPSLKTFTYPSTSKGTEENGWDCNVCTYTNTVLAFKCLMCEAYKGASAREEKEMIEKDLKRDIENLLKYCSKEEVLDKINSMLNGDADVDENSGVEEVKANKPKNTARKSVPNVRKKSSPTKAPLSPGSRKKSEGKLKKLKTEHHTASDAESEEKDDYHKLMDLNDVNLVANVEKFECPVCFLDVEVGKGATLQECLHSFCKECLAGAVQFSETVVVKCPFRNDEYSCEFHLQEREVKALVTPEVYERHLQRSITLAESQAQDSFHCKTPNCPGWCLFEDNVNIFRCPVCNHTNCLTCGAIHEGMNCRQYQDEVAFSSDNSKEAKKTRAHLQSMLDNGEAMRCPQCRIFVMRKYGCDWMKCTMCHTEICWVTKGPRWGPGGRGDTSGGCRCLVNGRRCHPKCSHCH